MSTPTPLYAYPEPNSVLMTNLNLLSHPEGQSASALLLSEAHTAPGAHEH